MLVGQLFGLAKVQGSVIYQVLKPTSEREGKPL